MAFDREAAKKAGYTDEEIDAYLRANPDVDKPASDATSINDIVNSLPPPTTVVPEVGRTAETAATAGIGLGPAALGAAGAYGAYELGKRVVVPGLANAVADTMEKRAAAKGAVAPTTAQGLPVTETTGPVKPSGTARQINIVDANTPQRSVILNAQGEPISRAPAQAAGAVAPEAQAAGQAARTAAAPAAQTGSIMSRVAPYLQAAGRVAAPVARVAGPVGLAASAYEAAPYLQQAEVGPRAASGEVGRMVRGANRMALNMPTPAPLSAQEARNLLASGDERTINIYGGRAKLQAIANPNAMNSGYAQQLNALGR